MLKSIVVCNIASFILTCDKINVFLQDAINDSHSDISFTRFILYKVNNLSYKGKVINIIKP